MSSIFCATTSTPGGVAAYAVDCRAGVSTSDMASSAELLLVDSLLAGDRHVFNSAVSHLVLPAFILINKLTDVLYAVLDPRSTQ